MATRMQQRRGTAQQWTDADPILAAGEIGVETDTNQFKLGDGVNAWSVLSYFKNLEDLGGSLEQYVLVSTKGQANGVPELDAHGQIPVSQLGNLIDGAPSALNTLNEIATVIGDSSNVVGSLITNIGSLNDEIALHESHTTSVHGIADTAQLATKTVAQGYADTAGASALADAKAYADTHIDAAKSSAISTAATSAGTAISTHNSATTSVHGIANTADLATHSYVDSAVSGSASSTLSSAGSNTTTAISTHNSATTSVHGISDTANLVYTSDSRLTNTRTPTDSSVTAAKIASDAVTTAKILDANVTTAKIADANVTTAKIADSAITSAKIADGTIVDADISSTAAIATSKISGLDSALSAKAPLASPTFTGTVTIPAGASISGYAPLAGPTFTGTLTAADATITGNLTVSGTTTTVNATNLAISDPLIYMATGNAANANDIGIVGHATISSTYQHLGFVRDHADGKWKLFSGVTTEPASGTIDLTGATYDALKIGALEATTVTPSSGVVFSDGTQTKEGVVSRTPIVQKTASYTLSALTERDSVIEISSASAVTLTVPANSAVAYPVGTSIDILQTNTGQITVAGAAGVTVNATPGLKLRAQWSGATLFKRATDTWVLYGDLSA